MTIFESTSTTRNTTIILSTMEFDVLWERLGYGQMPLIFTIPSPGKTNEERAHIVAKTWSSLIAKGLITSDKPIANLAAMLRVLDQPEQGIEGRFRLDRSVRALAASKNRQGVIATLIDGEVTLRSVNPAELASELVGLLPDLPAGHGHSVSVPSQELDKVAKNSSTATEFADRLVQSGVNPVAATALASIVTETSRSGNFSAIATNHLEQPRRADYAIGFFDTSQGRYLHTRRAEAGQAEWTTIIPANRQLLVRQLNELLSSIS